MLETGDLKWGGSGELKEDRKADILTQLETLENEGRQLGFGKTGQVVFRGDRSDVCVKIISEKKVSPNNVFEEMAYLDLLSNSDFLKRIGIEQKQIVPKPICAIRQENGNDYLAMETIDGITVRDLVDKDLSDLLPKEFDFKKFFEELRDIISKLNEANIYHRDLSEKNIMIDGSGHPIVIDFGDSCRPTLRSEDPYRSTNSRGETTVFTEDQANVGVARLTFGNYLKSKNFFKK